MTVEKSETNGAELNGQTALFDVRFGSLVDKTLRGEISGCPLMTQSGHETNGSRICPRK